MPRFTLTMFGLVKIILFPLLFIGTTGYGRYSLRAADDAVYLKSLRLQINLTLDALRRTQHYCYSKQGITSSNIPTVQLDAALDQPNRAFLVYYNTIKYLSDVSCGFTPKKNELDSILENLRRTKLELSLILSGNLTGIKIKPERNLCETKDRESFCSYMCYCASTQIVKLQEFLGELGNCVDRTQKALKKTTRRNGGGRKPIERTVIGEKCRIYRKIITLRQKPGRRFKHRRGGQKLYYADW